MNALLSMAFSRYNYDGGEATEVFNEAFGLTGFQEVTSRRIIIPPDTDDMEIEIGDVSGIVMISMRNPQPSGTRCPFKYRYHAASPTADTISGSTVFHADIAQSGTVLTRDGSVFVSNVSTTSSVDLAIFFIPKVTE